jgi:hypothetical protein
MMETTARAVGTWSTANGDDTMITIWNPADESQHLTFTLYFSGGHYEMPIDLDAGAIRVFNISEVIATQIPDVNGNTIPVTVREGSAMLSGSRGENEHILVAADAGVFNVRKATCRNICIQCGGATGSFISDDPFLVTVSGQHQLTATTQFASGSQSNETSAATWSTNSGNATVSAGLVHGVSTGAVTVTAFITVPINGQVCSNAPQCSATIVQSPTSPGTVTQCPSSVSLNATTNIPLEDDFPTYKTGIGIVTSMQVSGPSSASYNNSQISEAVSYNGVMQNNCPSQYFPGGCNGSDTFTVGQGGSAFGVNFLSENNIFYDQHTSVGPSSVLNAAGISTCTYSCNQTYSAVSDAAGRSCGGTNVGNFLITYTFTKDTIQGTAVTRTTATKH